MTRLLPPGYKAPVPAWRKKQLADQAAAWGRVAQGHQAGTIDAYGIPLNWPPAQRSAALRKVLANTPGGTPEARRLQGLIGAESIKGVQSGALDSSGRPIAKPGTAGPPGPAGPPQGTYDPALDQALAASGRGLLDLQADIKRGQSRGLSDYLLGRGNLLREQKEGLSDLLLGQSRAQQDYNTGLGNLSLQYSRLGNRQSQNAAAAGIFGGGAAKQGYQKRLINHLRDTMPLTTQYGRFTQDTKTRAGRLAEGTQRGLGQLSLGLQRQGEDWTTQLGRATREHGQYGVDTAASKWFSATQGGYVPPEAGGGKFFKRHGLTYQVTNPTAAAAKRKYQYGGQTYNRKDWLAMLKRRGIG